MNSFVMLIYVLRSCMRRMDLVVWGYGYDGCGDGYMGLPGQCRQACSDTSAAI